jgi:hypothetical protein
MDAISSMDLLDLYLRLCLDWLGRFFVAGENPRGRLRADGVWRPGRMRMFFSLDADYISTSDLS